MAEITLEEFEADARAFLEANAARKDSEKKFVWGEGADKVAVEIVAYGPGIGMLKMDSVVGARIAEAMAAGTAVVACENTMRAQKLTRDDMLSKIGYVPAGVVELMQRQKEGYA